MSGASQVPHNLAETAYLSVAGGTQHEFLVVRTN